MGGQPMAIETAAVSIYEVTGATAIGGTYFLLRNGQLIHPDLMSPKRDRFPAETFGVALFDELCDRPGLSRPLAEVCFLRHQSLGTEPAGK